MMIPDIPNDQVGTKAKFWAGIVANVGFPVMVSLYLLWKVTSTLEAINLTLARQQTVLDTLVRTMETLARR